MLEGVDLDLAQLADHVGLATMVGEGVPASGSPGHLDSPVDPVHGEGDDAGRVGPESKFREFEEVADLGREGELSVLTEGFLDLGLFGVEPELLMIQLGFQFTDGRIVAVQLARLRAPLAQLRHVAMQAIEDVLVVPKLLLLGLQILFLEELPENLLLVVHGGNG